MEQDSVTSEVILWTDGQRAETLAAILDAMADRVKPLGIGGPRVHGVDALANTLDCPRRDDLRQLVVEHPASFLLLGTLEAVKPADLLDAMSNGTLVLAIEPVASELQALAALKPTHASRAKSDAANTSGTVGRIVFAPAFERSPGFLSAADPFEAIGDRRLVNYESVGAAVHGSLFARLFDAWRTVLRFTETPESVDAALVSAQTVPDDLREVSGAIAAQARMGDGSAAVVHVADRGADTPRQLHVLGDSGELRVTDTSYCLRQIDGTTLDEEQNETTMTYIQLVAHQWRRLLDRPAGDQIVSPHTDAAALACCLACLLSARTAQPESPAKLLEMNR